MRQKLIYIAGFRQHAGKTTTSLGIISELSKYYPLEKIGYIKPVGQEMYTLPDGRKVDKDAKIIERFGIQGLDMDHVSPIRIASGFTKDFLRSDHREELMLEYRNRILEAVETLKDKEIIIVEGTGHPGVGGVVGLSNSKVSKLLDADIIYLAGGGLGKALDMLETDMSYFAHEGCRVKGIIFNKVLADKRDSMKDIITEGLINSMFKNFPDTIKILGYLPELEYLNKPSMYLMLKKFPTAYAVGNINDTIWLTPCRKIKIISLPNRVFKPCEYLKAHDVVVITAASKRRLQRILDYHKSIKSEGGLGGIVLTCKKPSIKIIKNIKKIIKYNIPAFYVDEDTAETDIRLYECYNNTKIQTFDSEKIKSIQSMFAQYFETDKFMDAFGLDPTPNSEKN
ncbi:MAG: AAA family ATPase [Spirochaetales bacterium]|nr:AAA family ATPase [Spirochaetales bacterium]